MKYEKIVATTNFGCFGATLKVLNHYKLSKMGRNSLPKHEILRDFKDNAIM